MLGQRYVLTDARPVDADVTLITATTAVVMSSGTLGLLCSSAGDRTT